MKPEYWQEDSAKFYGEQQWVGMKDKKCPARYLPIFRFLIRYLELEFWSEYELSILEIGCAAGHILGFLKTVLPALPLRYEGLDISPHHIKKARQLYRPDR